MISATKTPDWPILDELIFANRKLEVIRHSDPTRLHAR